MFTLLSGLWRYMFQKNEYYVLILGLDNVGKTTLLEQIKRKFNNDYRGVPFEKITNTVGLNIGKVEVSGVRLLFWDLGGHEELQSLWDKYYEECHGLIYVVDSVDKQRVGVAAEVFSHVLQSSDLQNVPLLVLFNKQDSQNALSVEDIKDAFKDVTPYIGRRDCTVQPVSALDGDGVENGIDWMVRCVKRNIYRPAHTKNVLSSRRKVRCLWKYWMHACWNTCQTTFHLGFVGGSSVYHSLFPKYFVFAFTRARRIPNPQTLQSKYRL